MSDNAYHLRKEVTERLYTLSRLTHESKTDLVNKAVDRYVAQELMRIGMEKHRTKVAAK